MSDAAARIAFVVRGVVQQTLREAGVDALCLADNTGVQSALIERWCGLNFTAHGLSVSAANKTELLLGTPAAAALVPLGDLYASEVAGYASSYELGPAGRSLAEAAGGIERLDAALRRLLDERRAPDAAFQHIPALREPVLRRLQATRFQRARLGIVPKLGARTIGIDLHI